MSKLNIPHIFSLAEGTFLILINITIYSMVWSQYSHLQDPEDSPFPKNMSQESHSQESWTSR